MHAAGCSPSLAPARAPRALRSGGCLRRCAPRAASRLQTVRAQESMSEAYARIRAQRAKTKARFEREEKLEKAGALGKLFSGVIGGEPLTFHAARCVAALPRAASPRAGRAVRQQLRGMGGVFSRGFALRRLARAAAPEPQRRARALRRCA